MLKRIKKILKIIDVMYIFVVISFIISILFILKAVFCVFILKHSHFSQFDLNCSVLFFILFVIAYGIGEFLQVYIQKKYDNLSQEEQQILIDDDLVFC